MKLKTLDYDLTICQVKALTDRDLRQEFFFVGKTDEELSLVCPTKSAPKDAIKRDDGWRGFRVQGTLDFSLVGILSELTAILAENHISIFALSTYHTDYILVKKEHYEKALDVLRSAGHAVTSSKRQAGAPAVSPAGVRHAHLPYGMGLSVSPSR